MTPKKAKSSKIGFEFFIDREQKDQLAKLSELTGAPMSEIVRRAIREYVNKGAALRA